MENRILTAFFSHKGQNYSRGKIIELEKGNTAIVAEMAAELTGGRLFEIIPAEDYPFEYRACVQRAKEELESGSRPALRDKADISDYDIIILGYPNWCGTMPCPVMSFLESEDFTGKTILPFCTNEGSGMGRSEEDLKKLCSGSEIKSGLPIIGSDADKAGHAIKKWLKDNGIM